MGTVVSVVIDMTTQTGDRPGQTGRLGEGFLWDNWYVAALSDELVDSRMLTRRILDRAVLLGRDATGQAYALGDRCPHRAVPLSAGRVVREQGRDQIECAYHGWRFGTDGVCLSVPANADPDFTPGAVRTPAFRVHEAGGLVWIWMTEGRIEAAPGHAPPSVPGAGDLETLAAETIRYPVHVDHAVLGLVDPAHGPYVHRQWWWRRGEKTKEKAKAFSPSDFGFTMVAHAPSESGRLYRLFGLTPTTEIVFRLPGLRWEHVRAGPHAIVALSAMTPISKRETQMTQIIWSNHPLLRVAKPMVRSAVRRFLREDEAVITAQSMGLDYDDGPPFLWVGDADQQARWYMRLKREWVTSQRDGRPFDNPVRGRVLRWIS